jgi:hypothetical protein
VLQAKTRCWCHTPAHEHKGLERPVNGDEVRNARFLTSDRFPAYDAAKVDDLLAASPQSSTPGGQPSR